MERYLFHLTFSAKKKLPLSRLINITLYVGQIIETMVMNPPFETQSKGTDMLLPPNNVHVGGWIYR